MSAFESAATKVTELPDTLPIFLTVPQAAFVLRLHPREVHRLCRIGVLKASRFDGTRLIQTTSVRELYGIQSDPRRGRPSQPNVCPMCGLPHKEAARWLS